MHGYFSPDDWVGATTLIDHWGGEASLWHEGQQTSNHQEVPVGVFLLAFGKPSEAVRTEAGVAPLGRASTSFYSVAEV